MAERSRQISAKYRANEPSAEAIGETADAIAYALSRMPATYAAVEVALEELQERAPGFHVRSLLDAGTGPGTAAWAAADAFRELTTVTLLDSNLAFLDLASALGRGHPILERAEYRVGDMSYSAAGERQYDLVTCAYALTELDEEALARAVDALWAQSAGALVIVEPGRPRDYRRLMLARDRLIAAGARIVAPCTHAGPCPLAAPDWCHFRVRLSRSREHRRLKGGSLSYEDEKFSYLAVARPAAGAVAAAGRIIRAPATTKFSVTLAVCAPEGIREVVAPKRDAEAFRRLRKRNWGDAL